MHSINEEFEMRTLAHDINGMLCSARLIVELLMRSYDHPAMTRYKKLERIVDRISHYCADVMDRTPEGAIGGWPDTDVVTSVLSELEPVAAKAGITCTRFGDPIFAPVQVSAKLHRILVNLIRNAFSAQQKVGGQELRIGTSVSSQWVIIDVSDDGPGLPECVIAQHWPVVSPSPGLRETSEGLGLRSSAAMAQSLGGQIQLLNSSSKGTTFRLTIPAIHETRH